MTKRDEELVPLHVLVPAYLRDQLRMSATMNDRKIAMEVRRALIGYLGDSK